MIMAKVGSAIPLSSPFRCVATSAAGDSRHKGQVSVAFMVAIAWALFGEPVVVEQQVLRLAGDDISETCFETPPMRRPPSIIVEPDETSGSVPVAFAWSLRSPAPRADQLVPM